MNFNSVFQSEAPLKVNPAVIYSHSNNGQATKQSLNDSLQIPTALQGNTAMVAVIPGGQHVWPRCHIMEMQHLRTRLLGVMGWWLLLMILEVFPNFMTLWSPTLPKAQLHHLPQCCPIPPSQALHVPALKQVNKVPRVTQTGQLKESVITRCHSFGERAHFQRQLACFGNSEIEDWVSFVLSQ